MSDVEAVKQLTGSSASSSDVTVDMLDFKYIKECTNVRQVEKILRKIKSGNEGVYPDLESFCEDHLRKLNPTSRLLRKDAPLLRSSDLDKEEWQSIDTDLKEWLNDTKKETSMKVTNLANGHSQDNIPPVRNATTMTYADGSSKKCDTKPKTSTKRVKPRNPQEWAKLEKELEKEMEEEEENEKKAPPKKTEQKSKNVLAKPSTPIIDRNIDPSGMSEKEIALVACREKEKGNEAFRSQDYDEAEVYYTRSISLAPSAAAFNNRALCYIKLKKWDEALKDTNKVLKMEPNNIKGLLRRGTVLVELNRIEEAIRDIDKGLKLDSNNAPLMSLLTKAQKEFEKRAKSKLSGGRRMVIEEVGSSSEESDQDDGEEILTSRGPETTSARSDAQKSMDQRPEPKPVELFTKPKENDSIWSEEDLEQEEKKTPSTCTISSSKTSSTFVNGAKTSSKKEVNEVVDRPAHPAPHTPTKPTTISQTMKSTNKDTKTEAPAPSLTKEELEYNRLKDKGNKFFKEKDYRTALQWYDQCITLSPKNVSGYRNRSVCHLHLDEPNDSIYNCNLALEIMPDCHISLYRRALARKMLADYKESLQDFYAAQRLKPSNKSIQKEIDEVIDRMRKHPRGQPLVSEIEEVARDAEDSYAMVEGEDSVTIKDTEILPEEELERQKFSLKASRKDASDTRRGDVSGEKDVKASETLQREDMEEEKVNSKEKKRDTPGLRTSKTPVEKDVKATETVRQEDLQEVKKDAEISGNVVSEELQNLGDLKEDITQSQGRVNGESKNPSSCVSVKSSTGKDVASGAADSCNRHDLKTRTANDEDVRATVEHLDSVSSQGDTSCKDGVEETVLKDFHAGVQRASSRSSEIVQTSESIPSTPSSQDAHPGPRRTPMTATEFTRRWSSMKPDYDSPKVGQLLLETAPELLPKVLTNKMDGVMFEMIINSLRHFFMENDHSKELYLLLNNLRKVDRFSINLMFLDQSSRGDLDAMFQYLDRRDTSLDVASLRSAYST